MEYPENTVPADHTHEALDQAKEALHRADEYVRENPVPMILGALAIGFALGLLVHHSEPTPRSRWDDVRDCVGDSEESLKDLLKAVAKQSRKAYKKGSGAVRGVVDDAKSKAHDIDLDDYTDPVTDWFRKLWKRAF